MNPGNILIHGGDILLTNLTDADDSTRVRMMNYIVLNTVRPIWPCLNHETRLMMSALYLLYSPKTVRALNGKIVKFLFEYSRHEFQSYFVPKYRTTFLAVCMIKSRKY